MNLYFCEQDVTNFIGEYLTEALVLASTERMLTRLSYLSKRHSA